MNRALPLIFLVFLPACFGEGSIQLKLPATEDCSRKTCTAEEARQVATTLGQFGSEDLIAKKRVLADDYRRFQNMTVGNERDQLGRVVNKAIAALLRTNTAYRDACRDRSGEAALCDSYFDENKKHSDIQSWVMHLPK
jgi:hypothetical protein